MFVVLSGLGLEGAEAQVQGLCEELGRCAGARRGEDRASQTVGIWLDHAQAGVRAEPFKGRLTLEDDEVESAHEALAPGERADGVSEASP